MLSCLEKISVMGRYRHFDDARAAFSYPGRSRLPRPVLETQRWDFAPYAPQWKQKALRNDKAYDVAPAANPA